MAAEPLSDQIISKMDEVAELYHRLILVVAPSGGGKTRALQEVAKCTSLPYVNLNLELSRRLLQLTERQRAIQMPRLLAEIVYVTDARAVLLDNTEILFETTLQQNPLALLQGVSRNKVVVAAWNGRLERGHLTYATPDHPEHRRYPARDLVIVSPQLAAE